MRLSSFSWVLPLVLALTLHHVLASSDADAQTSAQEGEDAALDRSKRHLPNIRMGRQLRMLRLGKRESEFEPTVDSFEDRSSYDGYYIPGESLITRYRRSLENDGAYSEDGPSYDDGYESYEDEDFDEKENEKRGLGMLRLGKRLSGFSEMDKRQLGMLRLGKRQLGMLRLGKRQLGMLRLGKRPMGMLRLGKRPMGMLRLGKRQLGMLRLGKRQLGMLRLGKRDPSWWNMEDRDDEALKEMVKRPMGMLRLGKKDDEDLKKEDKRPMGMLRLGKRDVSEASSQ